MITIVILIYTAILTTVCLLWFKSNVEYAIEIKHLKAELASFKDGILFIGDGEHILDTDFIEDELLSDYNLEVTIKEIKN